MHKEDPILDEIKGFYYSKFFDLLYLSADKGAGKSELIQKSLEDLDKNFLIFTHKCFKHSTINDFLLNFYDSLREYSASGKILLKKILEDNFVQKVTAHFKNIDKKCLIIIDNFKTVENDTQIFDFLVHLASFPNTKVVVLSHNKTFQGFDRAPLRVKNLTLKNNDLETFTKKVLKSMPQSDYEDIKGLWEQTKGWELFLRMSLNYLYTTQGSLKDFMKDFHYKKKPFEEFLLLKVASLVPEVYLGLIQSLSTVNHVVSSEFIERYNLGSKKEVEYLIQKLVLTKTRQGVYLEDYLKKHFFETLSVQEKMESNKKLLNIYENELSKSPKDRLLRLSRESIRKQIEDIKLAMPQVNKSAIARNDFTFMQSQSAGAPWIYDIEIPKPPETSEKPLFGNINAKNVSSKDIQKLLEDVMPEITETESIGDLKTLKEKIRNLEGDFEYRECLEILEKFTPQNPKEKEYVLKKLAQNYKKTGKFEQAVNAYERLMGHYLETKEAKNYLEAEIKLANLYKNLYRFEKARFYYENSLSSEDPDLKAKALIGLGEIFENEHKPQEAKECFEKALSQESVRGKAEAYFRLGLLYDDEQNVEDALKCYKKCIETSSDIRQNRYLSQANSNIGLLYLEQYYQKGALEHFELAIKEDEKTQNTQGLYFNTSKIAQIKRSQNALSALEYFKKALAYAIMLNDNFKIAATLTEIGDIHYDKRENEQALISYLEAQDCLGEGISKENKAKINLRINDMKVKLGTKAFEQIVAKYEK